MEDIKELFSTTMHISFDRAISSYATQSVTIIEASPFRGAARLEHTLLK